MLNRCVIGGQLEMMARAFVLVQRPARQRVSLLLKLGYLTSALQDGCVYSLASPTESDVHQARDCTREEAARLLEGRDKPPRFIEMLDSSVRRKKQARTASGIAARKFSVLVALRTRT